MSKADLQVYADAAAKAFNIPAQIFHSLIDTESSWRPDAISSAGAIGVTQLMPSTAADLGVDPWDPAQNIAGGAAYLSDQYKKFGNWNDALAAYNAGAGNIAAGQGYAAKVLAGAQALGYGADPAPAAATGRAQTGPLYGAFGERLGNLENFSNDPNKVIADATAPRNGLAEFLGLGDISFSNIALYGVVILGLGVVSYFGIKSLFAGALSNATD